MKGQLSRRSHNSASNYTGVLQQQGRMLTDADWNELVEVVQEWRQRALKATVGSGVPREGGMMEIWDERPSIGKVDISARPREGAVIVDGVQAYVSSADPTRDFNYNNQRDFTSPPELSGNKATFYVDVWERLVIGLQDSALIDPALHGADTCVRTQVLAQLKWCADPAFLDPANGLNPQVGNAELDLTAKEVRVDEDDTCTEETSISRELGNYLFRLEVHHVEGPANAPREIWLKWSSENGAEAHLVDDRPVDFTHSQWVYEFFNETTEQHLGVHEHSSGIAWDELREVYPSEAPEGFPFVRRWDGYCVLKRTDGQLAVTKHRHLGQPLNAPQIDGDGKLKLEIGDLTLSLDVVGKQVVAGDYWLVLLRQHGESVLTQVVSREPVGIQHHYLRVLEFENNTRRFPKSTDDVRRLAFPELTNLSADRLGYDPTATEARWTDINETDRLAPKTVQDAIDQLAANVEASDIHYEMPDGHRQTTVLELLADSVAQWPDLDNDSATTLKDMLDALLCHLDADRVPYSVSAAETIKDWLDRLQSEVDDRVKKAGDTMTGNLNVVASVFVKDNIGINTEQPKAALSVNGGAHIGGTSDPGNDNLEVAGNCVVHGNLTVNGTTTTVDTTELVIEDNIIRVNKYPDRNFPKDIDGGLEVFRGGRAKNAQIIWDEGEKRWKAGVQGALQIIPLGTEIDALINGKNADHLHKHSRLFGELNDTDPALLVDGDGRVHINDRDTTGAGSATGGLTVGVAPAQRIVVGTNHVSARRLQNDATTLNLQPKGGDLVFHNATTASTRVVFKNNGRVGIGNINPNAKLDVAGSLRINSGTIFNRFLAGTATIGNSSTNTKTRVISFPHPQFSGVPRVVFSARGGNHADVFAVTLRAISITSFTVNVKRLDGSGGWGQNLKLDWFAWQ